MTHFNCSWEILGAAGQTLTTLQKFKISWKRRSNLRGKFQGKKYGAPERKKKKKTIRLPLNLKLLVIKRHYFKKWKAKPRIARKYLQCIYLTNDLTLALVSPCCFNKLPQTWWSKQHKFIISQLYVGSPGGLDWFLCSGSPMAKIKVSAIQNSYWRLSGRIHFQTHSGCWQHLVPWDF